MGAFLPTGNDLVDGLEKRSSAYSKVLDPGEDQAIGLLSLAFLLADGRGMTCTLVGKDGVAGDVLSVSNYVLAQTQTTDLADFKALIASGDFVHPEDMDMAITNTANHTFAPHTLRIKRKIASTYIRIRVNSFWVTLPSDEPNVPDQRLRLATWVRENDVNP